MLKLAAFLLILSLAIAPLVVMRVRWATTLWRRIRLLAVIYVIVVFLSALIDLITHWGEIYG